MRLVSRSGMNSSRSLTHPELPTRALSPFEQVSLSPQRRMGSPDGTWDEFGALYVTKTL
jgi:hypothetical protein